MTMVALSGVIPTLYGWGQAGAFNPYTNFLLDAAAEKYAVIFQVPATGSIEKIHFRLGTVTTGDTLNGGLYTVDTNGDPTTTAYGGMTVGTVAVADGDDNITKSVTLAVAATTATAGDLCAFVLEMPNASKSLNIQCLSLSGSSATTKPFISHFTSAWAKQPYTPLMCLEYASTTFYPMPGILPFTSGIGTQAIGSATAPDQVALKLNLPAPIRLCGIDGPMSLASLTASDFEVHVYASDGSTDVATARTVLAESFSLTNQRAVSLPAPAATLSASTTYYVAIKPTSTNQLTVLYGDVPTAAALCQLTGDTDAMFWSQRTDADAWADTTTRILLFGLHFDQIDNGAGGGSSGQRVIGS